MYINNNYINIQNEDIDISNFPNYFEESEFISNLMLNPQKYRDFKCNINRINNIDNEINYLKSLEKNNTFDFVNNIIITDEEYQKALKDKEIILENLNEERLQDLLSHKKLFSHERHLMETMTYILGYESFDWNMFKKILNLYELKTKMQLIDYSKIKKRRINILLGQLCRSDKINNFLHMNDFSDSGLEFIYEWVKAQLKIYFYLYQNKKILKTQNRIQISKSTYNFDNLNNNEEYCDINNINNNNNNYIKEITEEEGNNQSNLFKNSTNLETNNNSNSNNINININNNNLNNTSNFSLNNKSNKSSSIINSNNNNFATKIKKRNNSITTTNPQYMHNLQNSKLNQKNKSSILITTLPYIINDHSDTIKTQDQSTAFGSFRGLNHNLSLKYFKEAKKVNFKLKGFNKEKDKILKEIKTAEMLPLLKNKTFPQMRNYYEDKIPFSKKIEKKMKMDIDSLSLNGSQDEKKLLNLIASGKMKAFNLESLFKLKNILKN